MLVRSIVAFTLCLILATAASAEDRRKTWFEKGYTGPTIVTLQDALREEKSYLRAEDAGYRKNGDPDVCAALTTVKLPCDYNTRGTLAMFLAMNGKALFPASGGSNPNYTSEARKIEVGLLGYETPNDGFVGNSKQNAMLATAVRKNAALFKNGDITAEAVKKSWR